MTALYNDKQGSSNHSVAITKHDTTAYPEMRALYVGVAGDVAVQHVAGTTVIYPNVPVGILPVAVVRVMSTGTGASGFVAMY